ncbi:unnamed protein product [Ambrosiozyma monospora]|uniref:Unnamed protein product n=1 Tax=Ambrosiozyma monospora TaxID=43982 RepID=A0A9W6Z3L1_AMBMO|nr:unnamed protein product [Ambrosiozyma monospora]
MGYNQLGSDAKKTSKKALKTNEVAEDGSSENKCDDKDVKEEDEDDDEDDEDDESFGGFLQTPMDETSKHKPSFGSIDLSITIKDSNQKDADVTTQSSTQIVGDEDEDFVDELKSYDGASTDVDANTETDTDKFTDSDVLRSPSSHLSSGHESERGHISNMLSPRSDEIMFDMRTAIKQRNSVKPRKSIIDLHERSSTPIRLDNDNLDITSIPKTEILVNKVIRGELIRRGTVEDDEFSDFVQSPEPEEIPNPGTGITQKQTSKISTPPLPLQRQRFPPLNTSMSPHIGQTHFRTLSDSSSIGGRSPSREGASPLFKSTIRRNPSTKRYPPAAVTFQHQQLQQGIGNPSQVPESLVPDLSSDVSEFYRNSIMSNDDVLIRSGSISRHSSMSRKSSLRRNSSMRHSNSNTPSGNGNESSLRGAQAKKHSEPATNLIDL